MGRSNKKWGSQACNEVMQKQDIDAFHQKIEFLHKLCVNIRFRNTEKGHI